MLLSELLKDVDIINSKGNFDIDIKDIAYNAGDVKDGSLFVAIQGNVFDGHDYIDAAVENGAKAIISVKFAQIPEHVTNIIVDNAPFGSSIPTKTTNLGLSIGAKPIKDEKYRFSRRIAKAVVEKRKASPIETTSELAGLIVKTMPSTKKKWRIHPATRVFQALRIKVNSELEELQGLVEKMPHLLKAGGRMVVVSYHSLEDRIVKHKFREMAKTGEFKLITKKPLVPSEEEMHENKRARSAKLRVIERV